LLKLPKLIEHYRMHCQWEEKISFFAFITDHYTTDTSNDADYSEDMKLPFKTINTCNHCIASFVPMTPSIKMVKREPFKEQVRHQFNNTSIYTSAFLNNIWQPPKTC